MMDEFVRSGLTSPIWGSEHGSARWTPVRGVDGRGVRARALRDGCGAGDGLRREVRAAVALEGQADRGTGLDRDLHRPRPGGPGYPRGEDQGAGVTLPGV